MVCAKISARKVRGGGGLVGGRGTGGLLEAGAVGTGDDSCQSLIAQRYECALH